MIQSRKFSTPDIPEQFSGKDLKKEFIIQYLDHLK